MLCVFFLRTFIEAQFNIIWWLMKISNICSFDINVYNFVILAIYNNSIKFVLVFIRHGPFHQFEPNHFVFLFFFLFFFSPAPTCHAYIKLFTCHFNLCAQDLIYTFGVRIYFLMEILIFFIFYLPI